jgi:hypothetical protein
MGEATYHLRAEFGVPISDELLERIQAFVAEGIKAGDWWRDHRSWDKPETLGIFWEQFTKNFPVVTKYLGAAVGGNCNNALAGLIDFGNSEEEVTCRVGLYPSELVFSAYVWHFADWDPFCAFLKSHFGALRAGWLSDEYVNDLSPLVEMT